MASWKRAALLQDWKAAVSGEQRVATEEQWRRGEVWERSYERDGCSNWEFRAEGEKQKAKRAYQRSRARNVRDDEGGKLGPGAPVGRRSTAARLGQRGRPGALTGQREASSCKSTEAFDVLAITRLQREAH